MNDNQYPHENQAPYGQSPYNQGQYQYSYPQPVAPTPKKRRGRGLALVALCTVLGGAAGVGGALVQDYFSVDQPQILYTTPGLQADKVVSVTSQGISLPDLYTMNVNSAVGITVSTTVNVFGQPSTSAAAGSGFVISEDGYIVTNHHVVEDAIGDKNSPIEVNFQNGDSYSAKVMGSDADHDLAVLKIEATGLAPVVFGDSDALVVGETVAAIGNPLGELDFSFTNGIISAKDRLISTGDSSTMNMLQTNTAINPGNSGGPLFDGSGALIGINTAKYTNSSDGTVVEGLGFAIPINDVKEIIPDLIANGYITGKPYMGITVVNVPAEALQYGVVAGASVESVAPGGAAEKAGLQHGDIIIALDEVSIDTFSALTAALNDYRAGDTAQLTVVRDQKEITLSITFDEKNQETEDNNWSNSNSSDGNSGNTLPSNPFEGLFP